MASVPMKHVLNLLRVSRLPIYHQLLLEEALLRNTKDNWVVINDGAFQPAIVMGISGKPEELINIPAAAQAGIQVIKRFTGGGTVVVDHDTIFTSLVFQGASLPGVECYPQPIMRWTEAFYGRVFQGLEVQGQGFALRENDYVFGQHKFGGNAQAITGQRFLHHTSLLWNYRPERMALLAQPKKQPAYRQGREHRSFLVPLSRVYHPHGDAHAPGTPREDPPVTLGHASSPQAEAGLSPSGALNLHGSRGDEGSEAGLLARHAFLGRLVAAAYHLPGFTVQERSIGEASRALQGKGPCGTRLVDLKHHLAQEHDALDAAQTGP